MSLRWMIPSIMRICLYAELTLIQALSALRPACNGLPLEAVALLTAGFFMLFPPFKAVLWYKFKNPNPSDLQFVAYSLTFATGSFYLHWGGLTAVGCVGCKNLLTVKIR